MYYKICSAQNQGIRDETTPIFEYEHGNCKMILGTATASQLSALERQSSVNGLYMKYLSQHLLNDDTITSILQKTQEGKFIHFICNLHSFVILQHDK